MKALQAGQAGEVLDVRAQGSPATGTVLLQSIRIYIPLCTLCCAKQKLAAAENVNISQPPPSRVGLDMATTLERIQQSFVIADPTLPDCPLIFVSDTFIEFTGCAYRGTLRFDTHILHAALLRRIPSMAKLRLPLGTGISGRRSWDATAASCRGLGPTGGQ